MIVYDRDGVITIEVGKDTIKVTKEGLSPEQTAARVAEALGEKVWWLDRAGTPVPTEWASGESISEEDRNKMHLLRKAGCECDLPLLGERSGVGPRCRLCNAEARYEG